MSKLSIFIFFNQTIQLFEVGALRRGDNNLNTNFPHPKR